MQSHIAMLTDAYCHAMQCDESSGRVMFWKLQKRIQCNVVDKFSECDDIPESCMREAALFANFVSRMAEKSVVDKSVVDLTQSQVSVQMSPATEPIIDRSPEAAEALMLLSDDACSTIEVEDAPPYTGQTVNPLALIGEMEWLKEHMVVVSDEAGERSLEVEESRVRRCFAVFHMSDGSEQRYYGDWHTSCYPGKDTVYFDDGEVHLLPREDIVLVDSTPHTRPFPNKGPRSVEESRVVKNPRKRPRVTMDTPLTKHMCSWACGQQSDHKGLCFAFQSSRLRSASGGA